MAAVPMATTTAPPSGSRDVSALKVSGWKTADVQKWLQTNNLSHLQTWWVALLSSLFVNLISLAARFFHDLIRFVDYFGIIIIIIIIP